MPYDRIPAFPAFFRDWIAGRPEARALLPASFDSPAAIVGETAGRPRTDRTGDVAERIERELLRLGADAPARATARAIADPRTFVVVTGQQCGPYTGPLLALHKALTAIAVARRLTEEARAARAASAAGAAGAADAADAAGEVGAEAGGTVRFVPVFWCASEDHDLDEIRALWLPGGDGPEKVDTGLTTDGRPAGSVATEGIAERLDAAVREILPPSDGRDPALRDLAAEPGDSLADWFARCLLRLTAGSGLAVFDPQWTRDLAAPVLRRVALERDVVTRSIREAQERKRRAGYEPVLDSIEGPHLFVTEDGRRRRPSGDPETIARAIDRDPASFANDVVSRPLVQSSVLPVAAFVGGPSEIAYFAELRGAFERLDVHFPQVLPRASMTLLSSRHGKLVEKFGLSDAEALAMPEAAPGSEAGTLPPEVAEPLAALRAAIDERATALARAVAALEPGSKKAAENAAAQLGRQLEKLEKTATAAHARALGIGAKQWRKLRDEILPRGLPQERVYGPLPWLARYGPRLAEALAADLDPFDARHRIVVLEPTGGSS